MNCYNISSLEDFKAIHFKSDSNLNLLECIPPKNKWFGSSNNTVLIQVWTFCIPEVRYSVVQEFNVAPDPDGKGFERLSNSSVTDLVSKLVQI